MSFFLHFIIYSRYFFHFYLRVFLLK